MRHPIPDTTVLPARQERAPREALRHPAMPISVVRYGQAGASRYTGPPRSTEHPAKTSLGTFGLPVDAVQPRTHHDSATVQPRFSHLSTTLAPPARDRMRWHAPACAAPMRCCQRRRHAPSQQGSCRHRIPGTPRRVSPVRHSLAFPRVHPTIVTRNVASAPQVVGADHPVRAARHACAPARCRARTRPARRPPRGSAPGP